MFNDMRFNEHWATDAMRTHFYNTARLSNRINHESFIKTMSTYEIDIQRTENHHQTEIALCFV